MEAVLKAWADEGADSLSVRWLAAEAGATQSAIGYHFDNLERLYVTCADVAADRARVWMGQTLDLFGGLRGEVLTIAARAAVIAAIIEDWTRARRPLAMARRRSRALGYAGFEKSWPGFWRELAALIGLDRHAPTLALFADGESARHLLDWDPVMDSLLLAETVRALVGWLEAGEPGEDAVRRAHRRRAADAYERPEGRDESASRAIIEAAADLLAERGHAGVTFRAIAKRAGVTLGMVVHHCGTRSELLHRALHGLYEREAMRAGAGGLAALSFAPEEMVELVLGAIASGGQPVLRAYDEIELAIYNEAEFEGLRGVVRSMDDPSGAWSLGQLLGGDVPAASLVAAYSATIRGIGFMAGPARGLSGEDLAYARRGIEAFVRA
ncbi:MAG: TetR/AcrR family transcriptional regulator [Erythrobacter sp.]